MVDNDVFDCEQECGRCLNCAKPSCVPFCPVGNRIPQILQSIKSGDYAEATRMVGHPFGEVCGYVCPRERQCQGGCVLGRRGESVRIADAEIALFRQHPYAVERISDVLKGKRVAVIGGGVSGVTFAVKTYEQGADVTLYERRELLSTLKLIPEFRLPRATLTRIERQLAGKIVAVNANADVELCARERFDVVYVATGASVCNPLGTAGEEFATPYTQFLADKTDLTGKKAIVVGGGNTAMDCARHAIRLGASVTVAYRRTRNDMPAFDKEIALAESEGANFVYNVAPVAIVGQNGGLAVSLAQTVSQGRSALKRGDVASVVACDLVVAAIGGKFDRSVLANVCSDDVRRPCGNVYVGGDAAGGKTVAEAVADAMRAAKQITDSYK